MLLTLIAAPLLAGCAMENGMAWCGSDVTGFDIEEVSVLESAFGSGGMRDALVLDAASAVGTGARWRVTRVDVLALLPVSDFDTVEENQQLRIEVWQGDDPTAAAPWQVRQFFDKDALSWAPREIADSSYVGAWWSFDFSELTPDVGMDGSAYVVGVAWASSGMPALGYSRYELDCGVNWTDYGSGFHRNSDMDLDDACSWPMFRVAFEVEEQKASCG